MHHTVPVRGPLIAVARLADRRQKGEQKNKKVLHVVLIYFKIIFHPKNQYGGYDVLQDYR